MHGRHRTPNTATAPGALSRTRWSLLLLLSVAQLMVILDISAVNVALPDLATDLNIAQHRHRLDDHQLLADLRQPAAVRRTRRRPARPPPRLPHRPGRVHRLIAGHGARRRRHDALRRPRRPGPRRRDAVPGRAVDHHHLLPGPRAREGARRLGRGRRRGRRHRRPARRRADRARRLARDLLHQPARRPRARRRRHCTSCPPTRRGRSGAASICAARCWPPPSLGALVYALSQAQSSGWTSTQTLGLGAAALAGLAAFAALELRTAQPLLRVQRLADRGVGGGFVMMLAASAVLFGSFLLSSLYLQNVLGTGALETGLAFLPFAVGDRRRRPRRQPRHHPRRGPDPARRRVRDRRRRDAAALRRQRARQLRRRRAARHARRRHRPRDHPRLRLGRRAHRRRRPRDRDAVGPEHHRPRDRRLARASRSWPPSPPARPDRRPRPGWPTASATRSWPPPSSPAPRAPPRSSSSRPRGSSCPSSRSPRASPSTSHPMTTHNTTAPDPPRRRADAERSIARILDAAVDALASDPEASMAEIARRAGVVRATIYVHFPTREALLEAVTHRAIAEVAQVIDAAEPTAAIPPRRSRGSSRASWRRLGRYHALVAINTQQHGHAELRQRHSSVLGEPAAAHRARPGRRDLPRRRPRGLASVDAHGAHPRRQRRARRRARQRRRRRDGAGRHRPRRRDRSARRQMTVTKSRRP